MIFQSLSQDFPYWRIVVPHSSQELQLIHNLITHPIFSITKESNGQNNFSSDFPPTPSKNTPPSKISSSR